MSRSWEQGSTRRWRRIRLIVLERDGYLCRVPDPSTGLPCGAPASHVDHIVELNRGGTDDLDNLRAACADCNLKRSNEGRRPRLLARDGWSW